ncbi:MAG: MazG family protein [Microthrixaceae bacterium]|nr:MazG family protein [Microthrixaceae bacterium]MCO5312519.1 MazG family protein [Microthrixaceae bacterium]
MSPQVIVVGLGPGGADLVTQGALDLIGASEAVFVRTQRHPACAIFADEAAPGRRQVTYFDDVYDTAPTMDDVYREIVDRLCAAAVEHGSVVYAVPGSPVVAERTVQLLVADDRVETRIVAALSFLDLAWARLGIDPIDRGVRVVDGHRFATDAAGQTGPLLVCQCDSAMILSDIKLSLEDWPAEPVTVIQRLGLPDEAIFEVPWQELDREVVPDHLTSLYIPTLDAPVAAELVAFDELVHALRTGCPWDREQTHASLKRYLLEESYELLEAIDDLDPVTGDGADELCEELGDVLFQVFFHATIAAEAGWFTLADVARDVHDKLYHRHPHVFGDAVVSSTEEMVSQWEATKVVEKQRESMLDGIPRELPALATALKMAKKAAAKGFVDDGPGPQVRALAASIETAGLGVEDLGDLLFAIAGSAQASGIDPEDALRLSSRRFRERFIEAEQAEQAEHTTVASETSGPQRS